MTAEEKKIIENLLRDTHEQFIADVVAARGIVRDSLSRYADGRVMTGRQAFRAHLIDTLGGYEDALDWLRKFTDLPQNARVVEKKGTKSRLREWLKEETFSLFPALQSFGRQAGMYYLMNMTQ